MHTKISMKEVKEIIVDELPKLIRRDPQIREFVLMVTSDKYPDKKKTEDRIERILDELKRDREENQKRWDENNKKWEENQKIINNMLEEIRIIARKHDTSIGALGARWGLRSEGAFRNALKAILEDTVKFKVERYMDHDSGGIVFGRPDQVELDLIIYNNTLIIAEIKSSISKAEMYTFWRKIRFYEDRHKISAKRKIVISPMVDDSAMSLAKELGIEVYSYAEDVNIKEK